MIRFICINFLAALAIGTPINFAQASGIAVEPGRLELTGPARTELTAELAIENPGSRVALLEIYPDHLVEQVEIRPESFTLEAGEERTVEVSVRPKHSKALSTTLSVVSRPLRESKREFQAAVGAKIPLTVRAEPDSDGPAAAIAGAVSEHWPTIVLSLFSLVLVIYLANHTYAQRDRQT